jgi:two-component system OmpR family response regulator
MPAAFSIGALSASRQPLYSPLGTRRMGKELRMDLDEIYQLTRQGEAELRSSATRLSAAELALLVRFDGSLSLAQVQATLEADAAPAFPATLERLRAQGLVAAAELDALTLQFQTDVKHFARAVGQEEADMGLASLQRAGFYVQIARGGRATATPPSATDINVVLIEDDPVLANFTRTYLTLCGMKVRTAGNRAEVVAEIRKPPRPHLILLDVMLPDADGFDILLRLRQHPILEKVPVIMLTGKATREAVIRGLAGGADGYVTKPFEPDSLMRAVGTVLGLPDNWSKTARGGDAWVNQDATQKRPSRSGKT